MTSEGEIKAFNRVGLNVYLFLNNLLILIRTQLLHFKECRMKQQWHFYKIAQ